jgi:hypothetical protein
MKYTLSAYERKTFNSSGGVFTVIDINGEIELSAKKIEDVSLEVGDQVTIGDVKQVVLQNLKNESSDIDFVISQVAVNKKAQNISAKITNPLDIKSLPALQVEATVAAATSAGDSINLVLAAGATAQILPVNEFRHSAFIVRGESDLFNVRLGYKTEANALNGLPFAPQASASIAAKVAVFVHNHSDVEQTIIAVETNIDTGA